MSKKTNGTKFWALLMAALMAISQVQPVAAVEITPCPDGRHQYEEKAVLKAASCTTTGVSKMVCSVCGNSKYEVTPLAHVWGEAKVTPATCKDKGQSVTTCTKCGTKNTTEIPVTQDHAYEEQTTDATCTQPIRVGSICKICGKAEGAVQEIGVALDHDYQEEVTEKATCTQAGEKTITCSRCDYSTTETINALGHTPQEPEYTAPTCSENGKILIKCSVCGTTIEEGDLGDVDPKTGHQWGEAEVVSPTCTEEGYTKKTCTVEGCGAIDKSAKTDATGHVYETTVVAATCSAQGYTKHTCSKCQDTYNDTPTAVSANNHTPIVGSVLKTATCTVAGVVKKVCKDCGAALGYETQPASHKYDDGAVKTAATCVSDGDMLYTCTVPTCTAATPNHTKTETIQKTGHSYGDWVTKLDPTCAEAGEKVKTCTNAGCTEATQDHTVSESIQATGEHRYKDGVVDATCTEPEKAGSVCEVCGDIDGDYQETGTPALGHEEQEEITTAATCTQAGVKTITCSRCDYSTITTISAGHKPGESEYVAATCSQNGKEVVKCSVCGETLSTTDLGDADKATEHQWGTEVVAPTCTEGGYTRKTCSVCGETEDSVSTDATGHSYGTKETVSPNCSEKGYDKEVCSKCGDIRKTNETASSGDAHKWIAGAVLKAATCTKPGVAKKVCEYCQTAQGYIAMEASHQYDEGAVTLEPTCLTAGERTFTCTVATCAAATQDHTKTEVISATGHNYGEWVTGNDATCVSDGDMTRTCTNAGCTEPTQTQTITATGEHNYQEITKDETCDNPAQVGEFCWVCGEQKPGTTPVNVPESTALGHDLKTIVTQEATCTENGVETTTCTRKAECGREDTTSPITAGHKPGEPEYEAPTCTVSGSEVVKCTVCGENVTTTDMGALDPATGHKWGTPKVVDPTCTEGGYTEKTCSVCGATEKSDTIAATSHSYGAPETVAPTCSEGGYTKQVCSKCGDIQKTNKTASDGDAHKLVAKTILKAATCTKPGVAKMECEYCKTAQGYGAVEAAHKYDNGVVTLKPTCVEQGTKTYTCTVATCTAATQDHTKTETINPIGHNYGEWVTGNDATCVSAGDKTKTCTNEGCTADTTGHTETGIIAATGAHDYVDKVIPATCTEKEKAGSFCSVCGTADGAVTELGNALGHDVVTNVTKEATCTEDGVKTTTCTRKDKCGYTDTTEAISAAHKPGESEYEAPTCSQNGKEVVKCSVCRETVTTTDLGNADKATGHTWGAETIVAPTCTEGGYTGKTCTVCGEIDKSATTNATGHTWVNGTVVAPTCKAQGYTPQTCSKCGETQKVSETPIVATNHTPVAGKVLKQPTCTTPGVAKMVCKDCDESTGYGSVAAAHQYDNGRVTKAATCLSAGEKTYTCTVLTCAPDAAGHTKTETLAATGHTYDDGVVTKEANCGVAGVRTFTCTNTGCTAETADHTKTDAIAASGAHKYIDSYTDATCTEDGMAGEICEICKTAKAGAVKIADKLGHDEQEEITKAATCTESGVKTITCSRCDYSAAEVINATGHVDGSEELKEATCDKGAYILVSCKNGCGYTYEKDMSETLGAAKGHQDVDTVFAPTCKEDGYTLHKCSVCGRETKDTTVAKDVNAHKAKVVGLLKAATCSETGVAKVACEYCDKAMGYQTIEKLAHTWGEDQMEEATTEHGTIIYHICEVCKTREVVETLNDQLEAEPAAQNELEAESDRVEQEAMLTTNTENSNAPSASEDETVETSTADGQPAEAAK